MCWESIYFSYFTQCQVNTISTEEKNAHSREIQTALGHKKAHM